MIVNSPLPPGPPATVPQRRSASSSPPADQPAEGRVPWDHHCDWAWFGFVSFNSIWLSSDKYELFVATFDFFTRLDGKFQERQHKIRADRGVCSSGTSNMNNTNRCRLGSVVLLVLALTHPRRREEIQLLSTFGSCLRFASSLNNFLPLATYMCAYCSLTFPHTKARHPAEVSSRSSRRHFLEAPKAIKIAFCRPAVRPAQRNVASLIYLI